MEEANAFSQSTAPSINRPKGAEDILDSHHKRQGADKKAPNPLAVAQFRERLEKVDKTNAVTDKSSQAVGMRCIEGDSESAPQSNANANSNVFRLSTISSAKKRGRGQLYLIAFSHRY